MLGTILGGTYEILEEIGRGGMATVYTAQHTRIQRRFAVKVLHYKASEEVMARFEREAMIASRLGHEHIVEVIDFNRTPLGEPYIVMELMDGQDLGEILAVSGPLSIRKAVSIASQVAHALSAAHAIDVVHRDLKPENIFISRRPSGGVVAKVMDFGISKVLSSGTIVTQGSRIFGTPWYMSPEQARGQNELIDQRADIYALGVVLYQMLSGKVPFAGTSPPAILYSVVHDEAQPLETLRPEVPAALADVVRQAMQKNPAERFPTALDLRAALASATGTPLDLLAPGRPFSLAASNAEFVPDEDSVDLPAAHAVGSARGHTALADHPVASLTPSQPPLPTKRRTGWVAAAVLLITASVVIIAIALKNGPQNATPASDRGSTAPIDVGAAPSDGPAIVRDLARAVDSQRFLPTVSRRDAGLGPGRELSVTSTPSGAQVLLDGKLLGRTPLEKLKIPHATAVLVLQKTGYAKRRKSLPEGRDPVNLRYALQGLESQITLIAFADGGKRIAADIYLDGTKVDQTPAVLKLAPGRAYKIKLAQKGYRPIQWTVTLRPGQTLRVLKQLQQVD
jgi:serine/threonine protein kinase